MTQPVVPPPAVMPTPGVHPKHTHSVHMAQLREKLAGTMKLTGIKNVDPIGPPLQAAEAASAIEAAEAAAPAAVAEPAASEEPTNAEPEVQPAAAPAAATKTESSSSKLARSLEIQRRAEATARRAKEDARNVAETRRQATKAAADAAALGRQVQADKVKLDAVAAEYQAKMRLLETNPLEFARQQGVDGAAIAQYVKEGADPHSRAIDLLRREADAAIRAVRSEADAKYSALEGRLAADKAAETTAKMQDQFFGYVDKASTAAPDQFQAMDVVYSKDELWTKANELAEKSDRLQLGWNPDRLLEEIETEAKSDPRWAKIQSRFQRTSKDTPKAPIKTNPKTETRPVEEVRADRPASAPRNSDGTFQGRQMTPMERHKAHVARVLQGVRF